MGIKQRWLYYKKVMGDKWSNTYLNNTCCFFLVGTGEAKHNILFEKAWLLESWFKDLNKNKAHLNQLTLLIRQFVMCIFFSF